MRTVELTRQEFLGWVADPQGADFARGGYKIGRGSRREVTLVWPDDDQNMDPVVVVSPADLREFLAFTSTYVGTHSPFTAFYRVIPDEFLERWPKQLSDVRPAIARALLGAVICDAAVQTGAANPRASDINLQACLAAPSYVISAATLAGYDIDMALVALDRWYKVRSEIAAGSTKVAQNRLTEFWSSILGTLLSERQTYRPRVSGDGANLLSIAMEGSQPDELEFFPLLRRLPGTSGLVEALRGTREQRVQALDRLWSALRVSPVPVDQKELIIGYVTSQVAEGSLNYLTLACRLAAELPLSVLWFGIFSGLNRGTDVFNAGECLGRRLFRKLRPRGKTLPPISADVGFEEFLLLSQEGRMASLRTEQQSALDVELIPGVQGRYRMARNGRRDEDGIRANSTLDQVRRLVTQLQGVLKEADATASTGMTYSLFDRNGVPDRADRKTARSTGRARKPQR